MALTIIIFFVWGCAKNHWSLYNFVIIKTTWIL